LTLQWTKESGGGSGHHANERETSWRSQK
jgi:hypothetical protein